MPPPFRAAAIMALLLAAAAPAQAAAPFAGFQAPGFVRTVVGGFEVTALNDGATALDAVQAVDEPEAQTADALRRAFEPNPIALSDNAYLINTGTRLVLIDAGGGTYFGPALGRLQQNIRAAGYRPDQVDDVLLTHMHRDHVGGLLADGKPAFPNAIIHANRIEAEYWLSPENRRRAPAAMQPRFQGVVECLAPYRAAGRFQPFDGAGEVVPGIRSVPSYGHSDGHTSYVAESHAQSVWIIGDLVNVAAVQFAAPGVATHFDGDPAAATASRTRILAEIATGRALVGAAHVSFPGLGHIAPAATGWRWVPLTFDPNPTLTTPETAP